MFVAKKSASDVLNKVTVLRELVAAVGKREA